MLLEACVNSAISALEAQKGGADRVELCENMADGGCTPSAGTIMTAKKYLGIPLFVMIRPRGGDFLYSDLEFEIMKKDLLLAKELGADGVVFGILQEDGRIDSERMSELNEMARPMSTTCHRAFDMTRDPFEAVEDLILIGLDRILTSGQSDSAVDGGLLIRRLIEKAMNRIIIMPGHGIKEYNIMEAINSTGANEFHLYLPGLVTSKMKFVRDYIKMGSAGLPEYLTTVVDSEKVRSVKEKMQG
ncbi:MAG TPA: copper homeostasis protein CutC [Bacteroidales bacterium]|nr:copper homeostasis protein CutC [Bacteroidales bacterium]